MIERKQVVSGEAFPVGGVFLSIDPTNPGTLLGYGVWASLGAGRVLVGIDPGDPDFDTVLETGGTKTSAHQHSQGSLYTSSHTGLAIDSHTSHQHPINTATISPHSGFAVASHNQTGDLAHDHLPGSLAASSHSGFSVADHISKTTEHTHAILTSTLNCTISPHNGFYVYNHDSHVHYYYDSLQHTHTILAGAGYHPHPQQAYAFTYGGYLGRVSDASASSATEDSINTASATLPEMVTQTPAGASDYGETYSSNTLTHPVSQPDDHTIIGSVEDDSAASVDREHFVTQPAAHTFGNYTGGVIYSEDNDVVAHSVTQPDLHTPGGYTDYGGGAAHTITSQCANHTLGGSAESASASTLSPHIVVHMWYRIS